MRNYWNFKGGIKPQNEWTPGCWMQVTCPDDDDVEFLEEKIKIPDYVLSDIADADERSRYDYDEGWLMIIMRIPYYKGVKSQSPFTTIPLGIILKSDIIITVCHYETQMMRDFVDHQKKRGEGFTDATDLVFRIFLSSAVWYLKHLKQVGFMIEKAKSDLDQQIDNKDLIGLARIQDSLTYFATSIRGNETLLSKLKFRLPVDELDAELIEDVNIEMNQARETTNIYTNILNSTMDTYANVINNNMNTVMRVLTSLNIIIMLPTLISSFLGMNLINGMEERWWGFPITVAASVILTFCSWYYFRRKHWI